MVVGAVSLAVIAVMIIVIPAINAAVSWDVEIQAGDVIDMGGVGLAICTDGVGSKTIIADMMGKYDTIGIDCVAMNVNDMICVGATPLSLVDYIAIERSDAAMLDAIGAGLCAGAEMAGVSIS